MLSGVGNQLSTNIYSINGYCMAINRPIYQYGGHIEFIRFKEYYGMPRGHSLSIYARFSGKKRTLIYISRQKTLGYKVRLSSSLAVARNSWY